MSAQNWTIALDEAVEHGGARHTELRLRPPRAGEMLRALEKLDASASPGSRAAADAALVCEVTGLPRDAAELLDRHVVLAASSWLAGFDPPVGPGDETDEDGNPLHVGPRPREWIVAVDPVASFGSASCAELVLRPPRQGEMQKALAVATAQPTARTALLSQIVLVATVTGHSRGLIEQVPLHLVTGAAAWLQGFTLPSPATTPSPPPG